MVPHGESELSPYEQISRNIPDVGDLKRFYCLFYIRHPGIRRHKVDNHFKKGFFLVYKSTSSKIYYLDMDSNMVKNYKYVQFDEGMNDL